MLSIRLLGSPEIILDERPLDVARRKSRALLYYLAAQPNPVRREQVIGLLWADLPRPSALQTLRTTLHGLKKTLGGQPADSLVLEGETVGLGPTVQVDLAGFIARLSQAGGSIPALSAALSAYRGDFLEGFSLPGAQAFEDWLLVERERLRRMAIRGWVELAELHEATGQARLALESLERALAFNPLQEDLQRDVIRLLYLAGDRPGAIQRYADLCKLLDEQMGVPPMAETRRLYDTILSDHPDPTLLHPRPAARPPGERGAARRVEPRPERRPAARSLSDLLEPEPDSLPFVGREAEGRAVQAHLRPGCLVLIEGEPGIGKTRLAKETLLRLEALPLVGRCRELEQALPYQPVIDALRRLLEGPDGSAWLDWLRQELPPVWLAETARLLPELTGDPDALARPAEEARLLEGLRQCLLVLAHRRRLVLLLDDLHWADATTLGWLGYLARHSGEAPLCLLATARSAAARSPLAGLLQALTRENRLWRLPLERLNGQDVLAAAAALHPVDLPGLAGWLWRGSEGNPYILVELARYARSHPIPPLGEAPPVPHTVYSLIQSRLSGLSEPARRFLNASVAAGREFDFAVAAQAAGLSEIVALDGLDELLASGLVDELPDGRFAIDHPLTMEVAYREVGEQRHRLLHRRVAEALEARYHEQREAAAPSDLAALTAQVAWQYTEAGAPQRGAHYALQAAASAARLAAWNEAIGFYEMALKGLAPAERLPAWLALADAHAKAGHFPQAYDVLHQALAWIDEHPQSAAARPGVQLAMARALLPQARYAEAIALAQDICAADSPESGIAAELVWGTALSIEGADLIEADQRLQTAEARWRTHPGDYTLLAQIHFERGSLAAQRGDLPQAIAFYRQSLQDSQQSASDYALEQCVLAYNNLAYHLHLAGDPAAAENAHLGLALAQEKGLLGLQTYLHSTLGEIALAAGNLDAAEAHFDQGLALAERHHISERVAGITANLGLVAIQRAQPALAIYRLSTALGQADALGTRHLAAQIRLWLAPLLPPEEARQRLAEARRFAAEGGRRLLLDQADQIERQLDA